MRNFIRIVAFLFAVAVLTACVRKTDKLFDYGVLAEGSYSNAYFGLAVDVPQGWYALDNEEIEAAMKVSVGAIPNKTVQDRVLKVTEVDTAPLLVVYRHEPGTVDEFNHSLQIGVENLRRHREIADGREYLRHSLKAFEMSGMPFINLDVPIEAVSLGGRDFSVVNVELDMGGELLDQQMYATVIDGFALYVVLTSADAGQYETLMRILDTLRFDNKK